VNDMKRLFKSTLKWVKLCTKRRSLLVGGDIENHKRLWEVYRKVKRRKWPALVDRRLLHNKHINKTPV